MLKMEIIMSIDPNKNVSGNQPIRPSERKETGKTEKSEVEKKSHAIFKTMKPGHSPLEDSQELRKMSPKPERKSVESDEEPQGLSDSQKDILGDLLGTRMDLNYLNVTNAGVKEARIDMQQSAIRHAEAARPVDLNTLATNEQKLEALTKQFGELKNRMNSPNYILGTTVTDTMIDPSRLGGMKSALLEFATNHIMTYTQMVAILSVKVDSQALQLIYDSMTDEFRLCFQSVTEKVLESLQQFGNPEVTKKVETIKSKINKLKKLHYKNDQKEISDINSDIKNLIMSLSSTLDLTQAIEIFKKTILSLSDRTTEYLANYPATQARFEDIKNDRRFIPYKQTVVDLDNYTSAGFQILTREGFQLQTVLDHFEKLLKIKNMTSQEQDAALLTKPGKLKIAYKDIIELQKIFGNVTTVANEMNRT
jgi:hypothetical protein